MRAWRIPGAGMRHRRTPPALPRCATACCVKSVTHREMRNNGGEILRAVAAGDSVQVTNNGQPAALIVPPSTDDDRGSGGSWSGAAPPASPCRPVDDPTAPGHAVEPAVGGHHPGTLVTSCLDTSAAMKLLVEEAESAALTAYLQSDDVAEVLASWLLHAEPHRAVARHPEDIDRAAVGVVLGTLTLVDLTRGGLLTAGALPGRLRSDEAVHLAVALRVGVDEMIIYDTELASAASASGLSVARPA